MTNPQPAGKGPPDTGTCGVPQRERSRTMAEAPEPQDPEPQNRKPGAKGSEGGHANAERSRRGRRATQ